MSAEVHLEAVTHRYGTVTALDAVDLQVGAGELVSLVGPSGSGKSTVLRLIAGLEQPAAGRVLLDGADVASVPAHQRAVAMVFQDYALYPHLTVMGNLVFGLRVRKVPRTEAEQHAREAAARLGIEELLDRYPDQMSGGQRQRVALARALVRQPQVYLLDEPLASLDAQLRMSTRADLLDLHRRLGTTTLHVTHDQAEAMTLADRVVVMHEGRIRQVGPPQEVYDEPADTFVASFLGSPPMNLVDGGGVLGGHGDQIIGIRPEDLRLTSDGPVAAVVEAVEALGNEDVVLTRCADGTRLAVRAPARQRVRAGDPVRVAVTLHRLHVFDRATGRRR